MNYPLASSTWGEEEVQAAISVLRSGRCTQGEITRRYEDEFAKTFGSKHAVAVNSGSSANLLAVASQLYISGNPLRSGDEVLVPAVAWSTTYFPLHQCGLRIRLVDIDPETLNAGPKEFWKEWPKGIDRVRGMVGVNLLGNPAGLGGLGNVSPLVLFEDNCESMGALVDGPHAAPGIGGSVNANTKFCGTFGKVGTFSTFFSHHYNTIEGGVAVTDDDETADIMQCLRAHGWTRDLKPDNRLHPKTASVSLPRSKRFVVKDGKGVLYESDEKNGPWSPVAGLRVETNEWEDRYKFILPGYNVRTDDLRSAIGLVQLKRLPTILEGRRKNAEIFKQSLADLNKDGLLISGQKETGRSSWYGFAMILQGRLKGRRKELVALLEANGVETRPVMSGAIHRQPVARAHWCNRNFGTGIFSGGGNCPNADYLHDNGFFIGNRSDSLADELEQTFDIIRGFADECWDAFPLGDVR